MNYELLQKQIKWADAVGEKIYTKSKVEKLMEKALNGKGSFDCAENDNFPLGYIFNFFGKKNVSFCVVSEELKTRLIAWSKLYDIEDDIKSSKKELDYLFENSSPEDDGIEKELYTLSEKITSLKKQKEELKKMLW